MEEGGYGRSVVEEITKLRVLSQSLRQQETFLFGGLFAQTFLTFGSLRK